MVDLIPRSVLFGNPERTSPEISPDGGSLAWIAPHEGVLNLWVAPIDSGVDWAAARRGHRGQGPGRPRVRLGAGRAARAVRPGRRRGRELAALRRRPADARAARPDPVREDPRDDHRHVEAAAHRGARRHQRGQPAAARRVPAGPGLRRAGQGDREPRVRGLGRRRGPGGQVRDRAAARRVVQRARPGHRRGRVPAPADHPRRGRDLHRRGLVQRRRPVAADDQRGGLRHRAADPGRPGDRRLRGALRGRRGGRRRACCCTRTPGTR